MDEDLRALLLVVLAVALAIAWYLSYAAARLDRLHTKVEGAMSALDAQLVRRAEASLELATSGILDPATSLLLADAAAAAVERRTEHPITDDPLDGQHFGGREEVESDLTWALDTAISPELLEELRAETDTLDAGDPGLERQGLARVEAGALRVQLARRFHNDAVADVRRVRSKVVVRAFRLAGHAELPEPVIFDDDLPRALRS
ncbi:MAG TPA: hypothetical protein PK428_03165 [Phycicoccus sp.]|jgi:hypothetical protein|nr:hypothetical protein [Phycicoccus sp.]